MDHRNYIYLQSYDSPGTATTTASNPASDHRITTTIDHHPLDRIAYRTTTTHQPLGTLKWSSSFLACSSCQIADISPHFTSPYLASSTGMLLDLLTANLQDGTWDFSSLLRADIAHTVGRQGGILIRCQHQIVV